MTIDIDAIEARANAATPGPWEIAPLLCGPDGQGVYQSESFGPICEVGDPYPRGDNRPQENMVFIAAARQDVPALCSALRETRAALEAETKRADAAELAHETDCGQLRAALERVTAALKEYDRFNRLHNDLEAYLSDLSDWAQGELPGEMPTPENHGVVLK